MAPTLPPTNLHEAIPPHFRSGLRRTFFGLLAIWTLLGASVLGISQYFARREELNIALDRAKDSFQKDLVYRRWAAERGGVYVPADARTPRNPYLAQVPDRDVTTTGGRQLTLVNPAYMTRMVHELSARDYGLEGHITSLRPLRPENGPDPWERKALQRFEAGAREYSEVRLEGGAPVLRYMGAFMVEPSCLKCHASQGYRVGDVRGGISVTVPIGSSATVAGLAHKHVAALAILGLWLLGATGLWMWITRLRQATREHDAMLQALDRNSRRFQALQDTTTDGLWFLTLEGRIASVNDAYCRMSGYLREDLIGKPVSCVEAVETQEDTVSHIAQLLEGDRAERFQTRHRTRDGRLLDLEVTTTPLVQDGLILAFLRDITRERESLQSVRESEARFRQLFESAPVPMLIHREGRLIMANSAAAGLLEAPGPEALVGQTFLDRVHPDSRSQVEARSAQALSTRSPVGLTEERLLTLQAREVWVEAQTTALDLPGGPALLVLCRDLTERRLAEQERRKLEAEIQHAQKLDSLGSLAGGIAHDMNNVLGAILGMTNLLQAQEGAGRDLGKSLRTIEMAANRGRDLVRGLMDFSRKGIEEPRRLDLNRLVLGEVDLLKRTTRQRFTFEVDLEEGLPPILGDPSALGSAFMNLSVNAFDAMPAGGTLRITTRRERDWILLQVEDTGEGIPPEVLERVTEPFFTTKPAGRGTGLGLSQVYGTVKAHGGTLELQSRVGQGTRVTISLPVAGEAVTEDRTDHAGEVPPVRPLRILAVDDDELIRSILPDMLEKLGHRVDVASGGLEALRRLEAGLSPDLVILDHSMPGMSGAETLPRIRQLCPEARILISTGFLDKDLKLLLADFPDVVPLQKPFSIGELRQAIAAVMGPAPG